MYQQLQTIEEEHGEAEEVEHKEEKKESEQTSRTRRESVRHNVVRPAFAPLARTNIDNVDYCCRCGKRATEQNVLLRCTACRSVVYCGRECQVEHWTHGHALEFRKIAAQSETQFLAQQDSETKIQTKPRDLSSQDRASTSSSRRLHRRVDTNQKDTVDVEQGKMLTVHILQEGAEARVAEVGSHWTVLRCKQHLFAPALRGSHKVRLSFQGQRLHDEVTLHAVGVVDQSFLLCSVRSQTRRTTSRPRSLSEDAQPISDVALENLVPAVPEVASDHTVTVAPDTAGSSNNTETAVSERLAWEAHARSGSNSDMILGFVMGSVLGVLALVWWWQRTVSRKQKAGILLGLSVNLTLNLLRIMAPSDITTGPVEGDVKGQRRMFWSSREHKRRDSDNLSEAMAGTDLSSHQGFQLVVYLGALAPVPLWPLLS